MKWMLVLVVAAAACTPAETIRVRRWPTHRQERDAHMEKLEKKISVLIEHVTKLEAQIAAMHGAKQDVPARPDTPTPASTPATP